MLLGGIGHLQQKATSPRSRKVTYHVYGNTWKQPRCPSADEWIRKVWYIYTMEYYSAIKKKAFDKNLRNLQDKNMQRTRNSLGTSHPNVHHSIVYNSQDMEAT